MAELADGDDDSCMEYFTSLIFLLGGLLSGLGYTWHAENLLVYGMHVGVSSKLCIDAEQLLEIVTIPVSDVATFLGTVEAAEHLVTEHRLDGFLGELLFCGVTLELDLELVADVVDERADLVHVGLNLVDTFVCLLVAVGPEQVHEPAADRPDEADYCGQQGRDGHQKGRNNLQVGCNVR